MKISARFVALVRHRKARFEARALVERHLGAFHAAKSRYGASRDEMHDAVAMYMRYIVRERTQGREPYLTTSPVYKVVKWAAATKRSAAHSRQRARSRPLEILGRERVYDAIEDDGGEGAPDVRDAYDIANETSPEEHVALREIVERMLSTLEPRQRDVVALRFGLDGQPQWTLEAISSRYGVCRERVRQIEVRALNHLLYRFPQFAGNDLSWVGGSKQE